MTDEGARGRRPSGSQIDLTAVEIDSIRDEAECDRVVSAFARMTLLPKKEAPALTIKCWGHRQVGHPPLIISSLSNEYLTG